MTQFYFRDGRALDDNLNETVQVGARGDQMTVKGTVKKHDEYRGVKQTVLTRCKYIKFEIVTADDAANMEAVA